MKSHPLEGRSIAKFHGYRYNIVPNMGTNMGTGIYHFFKNICGTQWILDIGYNMGMSIRYNTSTSIRYDTGTGTWTKMEYPCNLA